MSLPICMGQSLLPCNNISRGTTYRLVQLCNVLECDPAGSRVSGSKHSCSHICLVKTHLTYMGGLRHYLVGVASHTSNTGHRAIDYNINIYCRGRDTVCELL